MRDDGVDPRSNPEGGVALERPRTPERERRLETRPGSGSLSRADVQRDSTVRRWGVVTPSATVIGRAESPDGDLSENVRRLHDEQHAATPGYSERAHHLDRLRTTQALCNALEVTPWQRDLALGVMDEIDLTEFGSQRAIEKVALVVIRHVVDVDRRTYFGLDDVDVGSLSADRMDDLFGRYRAHDITDESAFTRLAAQYGLDKTNLNRLRRVLKSQLDDELPAYGRNPYRDPNLPESSTTDPETDSDSTTGRDDDRRP
ncbi:DNA-directed RNA polymerase subunit epsilon [Natrialba sp. INN-245]|uniref:DNA-directed RNA polymerase subunit epsilon n=1 Tax=Natrialba sp. INN-245 TaxID=2690967 RepID=UPI0013125B35|nr:DNA-directed RNA polymerase subunit epsilon [Natrialba sp. INN-245]MWV41352.1 DNA-directed RNA polymerase subunit epsilon [Natrialba sp. INN-245]